ncbi:DoxX family protein [soil metagenome]
MKIFSRFLMGVLFVLAGINHFLNPEGYYPLIPPYLPHPVLLNFVSGALEVAFGAGLMTKEYRKISAYGIIILMIAFIPAHVHHIQMEGCVSDRICIPVWAAWIRLVVIQPLIILWAYYCRK